MCGQLSVLPTASKGPVLLQNNNNKKVLSEIVMGKRIKEIDHEELGVYIGSKMLNLLTVV